MTTATTLCSPSLAALSFTPVAVPPDDEPVDPAQGSEFAYLLAGLTLPPAVMTPTGNVDGSAAEQVATVPGLLGASPIGAGLALPTAPAAPAALTGPASAVPGTSDLAPTTVPAATVPATAGPAWSMAPTGSDAAGPGAPTAALTATAVSAATALAAGTGPTGPTSPTSPEDDPTGPPDPATTAPNPSDIRIAIRTVLEVAAPAPAPAPPVASQVVQLLTPVLRGAEGAYSLSLRLLPEKLGEIRVEVQVQGSTVLVRLTSDNPAAQEALRASLPELRAALAAQGLTASSLEVGDGQAQPRQDQAQPRQDQAQPERALNNTRAVPQQHTPAVVLPRLAGVAAGLDLRL